MTPHDRWRRFDTPTGGPAGAPPGGPPVPPAPAGPRPPARPAHPYPAGGPAVAPPVGGPPPPGADHTLRLPTVRRERSPDRGRLFRPVVVLLVLALLGGLAGAGAYWFQPWKLVTDRTVQDALPAVPATDAPGAEPDTGAATGAEETTEADDGGDARGDGDPSPGTDGGPDADGEADAESSTDGTDTGDGAGRDGDAAGNRLLLSGEFVDHEHDTSGSVQLVQLADGRRQLVLRDLDTSDGPDLFVRLSDRPVVRGAAGWRAFEEGRYVDVARLKGNRGDQVYDVDPTVDLDDLVSVSIWCKRFSVSFGAAMLHQG